jgi:hypothetical protein
MRFILWTLTGSLAFWQLAQLRDTNPLASVVITLLYGVYGVLYILKRAR